MSKGLEDVQVAETRLSFIDGEAGELVIGGYPLSEIAGNATYEETLYLLYNDRLPTESELDSFQSKLASYRELPDATLDVVRAAGEHGAPAMDALRMGAASVSLGRDGDDPEEDALRLVAALPTITAAYWRVRNGEEPVSPDPDLRHAANYLYMLNGERPTEAEARGVETYLNTVIDHGLNASTFTGRVIVSTESDLVSAVSGSIGALKGPLHGGAPGPVLEMLQDVHESDDAESYVRDVLEAGERLMGFGHRVYEVRDPRAEVLSNAAESFYAEGGNSDFFDSAKQAERVAVDLLEEYKPGRKLETNVEFYTAVLLNGVGIPRELFTVTFAVSRVGGWTAHCREQLEDNRLIRPRAKYVGDRDREWTPVDER
jgi:citrate synthase